MNHGHLRELRKSRGITQEYMGDLLGITQQMYSIYEQDISVISIDILIKLANYYNVSVDYLLDRSERKDTRNLQQEGEKKYLFQHQLTREKYRILNDGDKEILSNIIDVYIKTKYE